MVRLTGGLHTPVGRSLHRAFRPHRATWHRRYKDEVPRPSCKVSFDSMVNAGQKSLGGWVTVEVPLHSVRG